MQAILVFSLLFLIMCGGCICRNESDNAGEHLPKNHEIRACVTNVMSTEDTETILEIAAGKKDAVYAGYIFEVKRGRNTIALAEVVKVYEDKSEAMIQKATKTKVAVGDLAIWQHSGARAECGGVIDP